MTTLTPVTALRCVLWPGLVLTMVLVLAASGMARPQTAAGSDARASRIAAPDFALRDATGATVKLSDYKGKVVLLDFWATWCTGCKVELPWYVEFDKTYGDRGLVSIGVAMDDEGWQAVTPYLAQHPIPYPIVVADADVTQRYRVTNLPLTLLIDRDGRIADSHAGIVVKETWEDEIRKLLQERPGDAPAAGR
jgi:peroxiredoxin